MSQDEGGLGGKTGRGIRDVRLVERALREDWPIPPALRPKLIKRLSKIIQDKTASPREITSACKVVLSASRINLELIGVVIAAQTHEELEGRLTELEKRTAKHVNPRTH
jgi:hypothetical protein